MTESFDGGSWQNLKLDFFLFQKIAVRNLKERGRNRFLKKKTISQRFSIEQFWSWGSKKIPSFSYDLVPVFLKPLF